MGENERLIAKALGQGKKVTLRSSRVALTSVDAHVYPSSQVLIATKFGLYSAPGGWAEMQIRGSPEYVKEACDKSLKALGVNQIDLYYQVGRMRWSSVRYAAGTLI